MQTSPERDDIQVPLCVDLDGTLINTDMLFRTLIGYLGRNPLGRFPVLLWWTKGRARLKAELAARIEVDPASLPYIPEVVQWVRTERARGRKTVLVTASDQKVADKIAAHIKIFDAVLASDGKRNLRGRNKGETLASLYGERGFDYAGNSHVDIPVWARARQAIVVSNSQRLIGRAGKCATLGRVFSPSAAR